MASTQERDEPEHVTQDATERVGEDMAGTLEQAARDLLDRGEEGVEHTLRLVVRGAIQTVPHVEEAGISLVEDGRRVESYVPSSDIVQQIDELQNDLGEGPCLDSIWHEQRTVVDDMAEADHRWPRYARAARELGIGSLMSFQLFAERGSAGALNLYASQPHVFDESTADAGRLFAAQAALVLHGAQRIQGLHTALASRDVIGQAKGILMERFGVGQAQAFSMLVESSQNTNMKLAKVAEWLAGEVEKKGAHRRS
ncbi:GAF and ANTAR domain-containing protein [Actinomycetospora lemnae]|uniref:GAF and ANTAR domain-containing protein n=1 Tax=Actinomycetospora lemnae TaxID=3019891 RepID=A0ABT5SR96_9PSEU|nr:GAF and ANTAR domain-containing protein [Actinomycetospora sp. DW7H6]MDD7965365.1 GAF and ANTAR domain-containing protein [Actinomycetospora sp. DW7H6]